MSVLFRKTLVNYKVAGDDGLLGSASRHDSPCVLIENPTKQSLLFIAAYLRVV